MSTRRNVQALLLVVVLVTRAVVVAQQPGYPGGCETPASQRSSDAGCYLNAVLPMEDVSGPVFWHLYTYPTMNAARKARSRNGAAVEIFGQFWVFTLAD